MKSNWRKSSYSGDQGNCIEVASPHDAVAVRDTKQDGTGPMLRFSPAAWHRFAEQVKRSLAYDPQPGVPSTPMWDLVKPPMAAPMLHRCAPADCPARLAPGVGLLPQAYRPCFSFAPDSP
jgi:hypothetical protein